MLIKNGLVFSQGTFSRTDILLEGGSIAAVGEGLAHEESFDASGLIIIPGMVNAHTHLAMTLLRGAGDDMPLQTWLSERIWPLEGNLTRTDCYWGGMLGIVEMIRTGTTCFNDMYFHMDATVRAVKETGMRAALTHAVIDLGDEDKAARELAESDRIEDSAGASPNVPSWPTCPTRSESFLRNTAPVQRNVGCAYTSTSLKRPRGIGHARERGMSPVPTSTPLGFWALIPSAPTACM
jgi:5-methylthioadenosine/S-adenosylhomocysteine deaminase